MSILPITRFTAGRGAKNKLEGEWTLTYKIALLQLVETEIIFSKEIMSNLQTKNIIVQEIFGGELSSNVVS